MNTNLFTVKGQFDDLEIHTSDENTKYYAAKWWLVGTSEYFRAILSNGMAESNSNSIKLNHSPKVVLTLLRCVHQAYLGEDYLKKNYFEKLNSVQEICEFFNACNEYQFDSLKNLFEKYCSTEEQLISLYGTDATELIKIIYLLDLKLMGANLKNIIVKNPKMIESIKYETLMCEHLNFFNNWCFFIEAFILWLKCHEATDLLLVNMYKNYDKMPKGLCEKFIREIRKLKKARQFKAFVLEKITFALYPEEEKK